MTIPPPPVSVFLNHLGLHASDLRVVVDVVFLIELPLRPLPWLGWNFVAARALP